jgi:selenocysteine lyase/cysteine desulfurase
LGADMADVAGASLADLVRHRFPVFEHRTYVNSCSQGALSDTVRAAYEDYLAGLELEGSLWGHWVERLERVRGDMARVFSASPQEIAITASASASVNAVASALDFSGQRTKVVTTDLEFPTTGQIWHAQERRGASVLHVRSDADHTIPLTRFADAIDDTTAIVSLTHVCFRNGSMLDLEPIIELAHSRGALVLVDAYQSVGAVPIDVRTLQADFIVGGMLKYLLSSPGIGFLFARSSATPSLVPLATGWFAARDIFEMAIDKYDPATDARRFEAGTPPVPSLYAAAAGIELMLEIGIEATRAHVSGLHIQLREGIAQLGGTVVTPMSGQGPMVAVASRDENQHVAALEAEGVVTSCRDGNVRISPHCYNNAADMDRIISALHAHRHLLR